MHPLQVFPFCPFHPLCFFFPKKESLAPFQCNLINLELFLAIISFLPISLILHSESSETDLAYQETP